MEHRCENGAVLVRGRYYLYNNLWGADAGSGSQCIWDNKSEDGKIAWGTQWAWSENPHRIKSFAAVVLGWHGGWTVPDTGLPIQLATLASARTTWAFDLRQQASDRTNVTYDMWLSDRPDHQAEDAKAEVMVWLARSSGIRPIGAPREEVAIGSATYALWKGAHPEGGWPVFSFVRDRNTNASTLDLATFLQLLSGHGLAREMYLLGIEAGIEVFVGAGRLDNRSYSLEKCPPCPAVPTVGT